MRTDRELLELAAKAASIGPLDFDYAEREGHGFHMGPRLPMPQGVLMAAMWTYWNPLDDDADALCLAVKCGIDVLQSSVYAETQAVAAMGKVSSQLWGDDAFAAEIGAQVSPPALNTDGGSNGVS
jgi:hypothetical protein